VPDDLLRHVIGPTAFPSWWLWIAVALLLTLVLWYAAVIVLTMPGRRLRELPLIGATRHELLKRRFLRAVRAIGARHRAGELAAGPAAAAVSSELRSFLHQATGTRAEYMQLDAIAVGELSSAAPVLTELADLQFNAFSTEDFTAASESVEELIRTWS
jgi:hypothetical protein